MPLASIDIQPLTPQRLPDFLDFFERRAFTDNPKWLSCYCHFPHADHARIVWKDRSAAQNRAATCERIANATMTGWLAYDQGQVIGWCNAGPRRFIEGLFDVPEPQAERIGSIACFVIAPAFRGQGVATALLGAACDGLRATGFVRAGSSGPRPTRGPTRPARPRTTMGLWPCTPPPASPSSSAKTMGA